MTPELDSALSWTLAGTTLAETCKICQSEDGPRHVVPIRSLQGHMALLDLSAPFLFQGRRGGRRYYGSVEPQ